MQLGQPEFVGAVDQNGVGVRVINARFNDGGTEQDVGTLLREITHDPFQFPFIHLAVANNNAGFGYQLGQPLTHVLNGVDLIVQEVHLATAVELAQHCFPDDAVREIVDKGFDSQPLLRCGSNHRKIP